MKTICQKNTYSGSNIALKNNPGLHALALLQCVSLELPFPAFIDLFKLRVSIFKTKNSLDFDLYLSESKRSIWVAPKIKSVHYDQVEMQLMRKCSLFLSTYASVHESQLLALGGSGNNN